MDKRIDDLMHRLIIEANDPGEINTCPICDGILHVRFESYARHGKDLVGVNIFCEKCKINIASDYSVEHLPAWLKQ